MNISQRELTCLVDNLRELLKTFDQASKCIQIPLQNAKVEIGPTKTKNNLVAHYYNDINEHPKRQIGLSFRFENNNSRVFSLKSFQLDGNHILLKKLSTLTIVKLTLQTSVKESRAFTRYSAFTPDCG